MKKKILVIVMIVLILTALCPAALAAGGGAPMLDFSKPDTGVTDPNILKEVETPYPPSLNLLFVFLGAAVLIVIIVLVTRMLVKKYRSKHRDIYGRW